MPKSPMTTLQRQQRLIYRVEAGKRCLACNLSRGYNEYYRDARRMDYCASTCKACQRIKRTLKSSRAFHLWPSIRLAMRRKNQIAVRNDPPPMDVYVRRYD